jgi:hypothetical protein
MAAAKLEPGSGAAISSRTIGATTGALLALLVTVALYLVTSIREVDAILQVRFILDGGFNGSTGLSAVSGMVAWVIPPLAAAIGGFVVAPRATSSERWAGPWMGAVTYLAAVILGPLLILGPSVGEVTDGGLLGPIGVVVSLAVGALTFSLLAAIILAPLLVICIGAGIAWAKALSRIARSNDVLAIDLAGLPHPLNGRLLFVITVGLLTLWLLLAISLNQAFDGGFD